LMNEWFGWWWFFEGVTPKWTESYGRLSVPYPLNQNQNQPKFQSFRLSL
jgi:hypothetical protein